MDWKDRKAAGDAHEERVIQELEARGWTVSRAGSGTYKPEVQYALSRTDSRFREFPDLLAARGLDIVAIDAKDRVSSAETGRYAISRRCVAAGQLWTGSYGLPLFYVLGNLGVLTPSEVMAYGMSGPRGMGGSYYLVNARLAHQFDDVFGSPVVAGQAA